MMLNLCVFMLKNHRHRQERIICFFINLCPFSSSSSLQSFVVHKHHHYGITAQLIPPLPGRNLMVIPFLRFLWYVFSLTSNWTNYSNLSRDHPRWSLARESSPGCCVRKMLLEDLRKEIDMAVGRFGPEGQVEKRILRGSSDVNFELEFQHLGSSTEGSLFFVENAKSKWATFNNTHQCHSIRRVINS